LANGKLLKRRLILPDPGLVLGFFYCFLGGGGGGVCVWLINIGFMQIERGNRQVSK
jgi:hypothetical protein